MNLVIRLATDQDTSVVFNIFGGTRSEFGHLGWEQSQLDCFLRQQFDFQQRGYASTYPHATTEIIVVDGVTCGYQLVDRSGPEVVLVEVAVSPDFRGRGVGSKVLELLLESARRCKQDVVLNVRTDNPAQSLYERFGFSAVGEHGFYRSMRWESSFGGRTVAA